MRNDGEEDAFCDLSHFLSLMQRDLPDFTCRNMATERQITCCEIKAADAEFRIQWACHLIWRPCHLHLAPLSPPRFVCCTAAIPSAF
jgi:hypothetical protein